MSGAAKLLCERQFLFFKKSESVGVWPRDSRTSFIDVPLTLPNGNVVESLHKKQPFFQ